MVLVLLWAGLLAWLLFGKCSLRGRPPQRKEERQSAAPRLGQNLSLRGSSHLTVLPADPFARGFPLSRPRGGQKGGATSEIAAFRISFASGDYANTQVVVTNVGNYVLPCPVPNSFLGFRVRPPPFALLGSLVRRPAPFLLSWRRTISQGLDIDRRAAVNGIHCADVTNDSISRLAVPVSITFHFVDVLALFDPPDAQKGHGD